MGADPKRKEARKRKFGAQQGPTDDKWQSTAREPGQDATEQQVSRMKQRDGARLAERAAESYVVGVADARDTLTTAFTEQQNEQSNPLQESKAAKDQRFIVFIGL